MKTITQHIRDRIESCLVERPDYATLKKTEWSKTFETLMRNRLLMGAFRYGLMKDPNKTRSYDLIKSMERRIELYRQTGNLEYLADVANLALLEFEYPSHKHAHFHAVDDGEHCK